MAHEHRFEPIIGRTPMRWDGGSYVPGLEYIAGHEPCECGMTYTQFVLSPFENARAALRLARERARRWGAAPWRGARYPPKS